MAAPTAQQTREYTGALDSVHQGGQVKFHVLLPPDVHTRGDWPVLYLLPVEGAGKQQFGSGLEEARKANLAERLGVICVWPEFNTVPWYGDHATNPHIAQEAFILKELIPAVEGFWPVRKSREGRWLLGFSKSGWGAYTLLLRHPDVFGYAAAWDAPFSIDGEGKDWGPLAIKKVMGTKENFMGYIPMKLLRERQDELAGQPARLVLGGWDIWVKDTKAMHALLQELGITHVYRDDLKVKHRWDSGWFVPLAEDLARIATTQP